MVQYKKYNWNICGELKVILLSCWACTFATQSFVAFCVSGRVGTQSIVRSKSSHLNENRFFQDRKMW